MSVMKTQLRGVARRPTKLLLTGLGIVVAAFFAFATVLAQGITEKSVGESLTETPNATSVVVQGGPEALPKTTFDAISKAPGVAEAAGRVNGGVELGATRPANGSGAYLSLTADPGKGSLARTKVKSGSYPDAPGEIAITARTAERDGYRIGQHVVVRVDDYSSETPKPGKPIALTVTGVVTAPHDSGQTLYGPEESVMAILGTGPTRIDVRAGSGADPSDLIASLTTLLPPLSAEAQQQDSGQSFGGQDPDAGKRIVRDATAVRDAEAKAAAADIKPIFMLLSMFVLIAVIAAALVVTSTFRIMFAQRMSQLALLRAVGAERGALVRALTLEGALTGLVAGTAGVLLAIGAGFLTPLVTSAFGFDLPTPGVPLGWAVGIVFGSILVTVLAVLAPAVSAARVSPLQALRASATTNSRTGIGVFRALFGGLMVLGALGTAGLSFAIPNEEGSSTEILLLLLLVSGTAAFAALLALGPVVVRPILGFVGWPVRRSGPVGRLAVGGVGGAPRRAAAIAAVVALGVTLVAGVLVGSSTLREYANSELAAQYPADIEVTGNGGALPAGLAQKLQAHKELSLVLPYRRVDVKAGKNELSVVDADVTALPLSKKFQLTGGALADIGPGKVAISESYGDVLGLKLGDEFKVTAGDRQLSGRIVAVLAGGGTLSTGALVDPSDLAKLDPSAQVSGVLANSSDDSDDGITAARAAVLAETNTAEGVAVSTLADERNEINNWLTGMTIVALALLGLTVLIAVVGVGTTVALSVVERTKESGMLRAIGLTRTGLRTSLATEAGLYGVVGSTIGLAFGVVYAGLMIKAINIGAGLVVPVGQLAAVFVVLAALTALAGLLPARRAAKVSPVAALAHE
jgi:putative ABC transport system permease protein